MKTTITKRYFTFFLLLSGMFTFSVAKAQFVCSCTNNQPGYCYVDNHGNYRCHRIRPHGGGIFRIDGIGGMTSGETSSTDVLPNPVSNSTAISFTLEQSQKVSLSIFDMNGRLVSTLADKIFEEGENKLMWNAENVSPGIYFLELQTAENLETLKLAVTN